MALERKTINVTWEAMWYFTTVEQRNLMTWQHLTETLAPKLSNRYFKFLYLLGPIDSIEGIGQALHAANTGSRSVESHTVSKLCQDWFLCTEQGVNPKQQWVCP